MNCSFCGKPVAEGQRFCQNCGAEVKWPEPQPVQQPKGEKMAEGSTLYLKFPSLEDPTVRHMKLVFNMFPGTTPVKMVMADTRKVFGTRVLLHKALVQEARETLGEANVVVK